MPPKKKDKIFLSPGTPATRFVRGNKKKKTPAVAADPPPVPGPSLPAPPPRIGRHRDLGKELIQSFASAGDLATHIALFDIIHLRPISQSFQNQLERLKKFWISFFTMSEGSTQAAEATLAVGAPFPALPKIKAFVHFIATHGRSGLGIGGITGWTVHTTRKFLGRILTMLGRQRTLSPTKDDRNQLYNAITTWAYDKVITTKKREKRIVMEDDLAELLAACLHPNTKITTNHARLTLMTVCSFLYTHGVRPGTIVEVIDYKGLGQYLKWKDSEWFICGWDEGAGFGMQVAWVFEWGKGQRYDDSLNVKTSQRNLGRTRMHLDSLLFIEALAISADVFEENLIELRARDPTTMTFPFRLHIKKEARDKPVFCRTDGESPLGESHLRHLTKQVKQMLGWPGFHLYCFRYGFASTMLSTLSKENVGYLMGHVSNSVQATTTYQAPHRAVDVAGERFGEQSDSFAEMAARHSSVAWNRTLPPALNELKKDARLKGLMREVARTEKEVQDKYGKEKTARDLVAEGKRAPCVDKAMDALSEMMTYYMTLSAGSYSDPAMSSANTGSSSAASIVDSTVPPTSAASSNAPSSSTPSSDNASSATAAISPLITDDVMNSMMAALGSTDHAHPFIALVASDPVNARLTVIKRFLALLHLDNDELKGLCEWCYSNPQLSEEERKRDHSKSGHMGQHLMGCELANNPDHWRCPICGMLVPVLPQTVSAPKGMYFKTGQMKSTVNNDLSEAECEAIYGAYVAHSEGCFEHFMDVLRGDVEAVDLAKDVGDDDEECLSDPEPADDSEVEHDGKDGDEGDKIVPASARDDDVEMVPAAHDVDDMAPAPLADVDMVTARAPTPAPSSVASERPKRVSTSRARPAARDDVDMVPAHAPTPAPARAPTPADVPADVDMVTARAPTPAPLPVASGRPKRVSAARARPNYGGADAEDSDSQDEFAPNSGKESSDDADSDAYSDARVGPRRRRPDPAPRGRTRARTVRVREDSDDEDEDSGAPARRRPSTSSRGRAPTARASRRSTASGGSDRTMQSGNDTDTSMRSVAPRSLPRRSVSVVSRTETEASIESTIPISPNTDGTLSGPLRLSVQIKLGRRVGGRPWRLTRLLLCPVCFFDELLDWFQRFIVFTTGTKLTLHMGTHWGDKTGISYTNKHSCGFPECTVVRIMTTGEYIEHLHLFHEYSLLQCVDHCGSEKCQPGKCPHAHLDTCYQLPAKFQWHDDARLFAHDSMPKEHRLPLPSTTLIENRKTELKTRAHKQIFEKLEIAPFTLPPVAKPSKGKPAAKKRKLDDELPIPQIDPDERQLRLCMLEIARLPQFAEINPEAFITAKLSLATLVSLPRDQIPTCNVTFNVLSHKRFVSEIQKWIAAAEMKECVVMLGETYPEMAFHGLLGAEMSVEEFLNLSAADIAECDIGLVVTDNVWSAIRASIAGWKFARDEVESG
ncbi:hypothetical protein DFH08DRAFT_374244 [Mycena albidolilacea]|uniref:Uncharacterized protein n=1 Tax=Mycena albidolilacea TaxID=1033008 RepID=A0AAD7F1Z7_9AGAR|nr:hypothetical protein DFH08DRAFT_374244 [Mycena albidolilacea]